MKLIPILLFVLLLTNTSYSQETGILKPPTPIHQSSGDSLSLKLKQMNNHFRKSLDAIKIDTTSKFEKTPIEIHWYALENIDDSIYWSNVYLNRILIEFKQGVDIYTDDVKKSLFEMGLTYNEIVDSSMFKHMQNFYLFKIKTPHTKAHIIQLVNFCKNNNNILCAEPEAILRTFGCTPNDPKWLSNSTWQWGNILTDVDSVWCYFNGGSNQIITVIDDALDIFHEDFDNKAIFGYDVAENDTNYLYDVVGRSHGTHVSGIIIATKSNNKGIAGIVNDTLFFAKISRSSDSLGVISTSSAINAINGVSTQPRFRVINMSFGTPSNSMAFQTAIQTAFNNGKVLVAAAGNSATDDPMYPAAYSNVISVSAASLTSNGNVVSAPYTNYGNTIDIAAPGGNNLINYTGTNINLGIISTVPANNQYENFEGTSMAAPYVTGIAALLFDANPFLNNVQVRNILTTTAIDYGTTGKDYFFGDGCVNAFSAYVTACSLMPQTIWANRTTFCQGETAILNAPFNENVTYQWRLNGINIPGANSSTLVVSASGNYSVRIQTAGCFSNSIIIPITVTPNPNVPIVTNSGLNSFCQGQTTTLSTSTASGLTYQWLRDGSSISNETNTTIVVGVTGSYQVEVTSNGCRSSSQPISIIVHPNPTIPQISAPLTSFCAGSSVTISCTNVANSYQWKRNNINIIGATSNVLVVNQQGSYMVEANSIHNCISSSISVDIIENISPSPPTITASGSTEFCKGGSVILYTQTVGVSYQWLINNIVILNSNSDNYLADETGLYTLRITNTFNCTSSSNPINVTANDLPPKPIIINLGATLQSSVVQGNQWYRNSIPIQGAIGNMYSPVQSGRYFTRVTNIYGCISTSDELDYSLSSVNEFSKSDLVIYPNPTSNLIFVSSNEICTLDVYDIFGMRFMSDVKINIGENVIESTNLPKGIYLLKFSKNESLYVHKIIID